MDTTAFGLIKKAFRRQKTKHVLLHHALEEFIDARSVLNTRRYRRLANGQIIRAM